MHDTTLDPGQETGTAAAAPLLPRASSRDRTARRRAKTAALVTRLQGSPPNRNRPHFPVYLRLSTAKNTQLATEESLDEQWEKTLPVAVKLAKEAGGLPIELYVDSDRSAANPHAGLNDEQLKAAAISNLAKAPKSRYERLEYRAMIGALTDGRASGFVTRWFDRMNRS